MVTVRRKFAVAPALAAIAIANGWSAAAAQDSRPEVPVEERESEQVGGQDESGVDEIIVTAQFRGENLQDVPVAISSVSGDSLSVSGANDLTALSAKVPGLYLSSYSTLSPQLYMRGVGSNDDGITSEGAVGVYIDGIYVGRASAALFDLYDIDRIEVLRGPQGTLYGRNTNGGAIRIETARPSSRTEAAAEIGFGNFGQHTFRGRASGGLSDSVFGKVAIGYKARDGWTRDEVTGRKLNDEDSFSARGQLRFDPGSEVSATLSFDFARDRPTSSFKEVVAGTLFDLYRESDDRFAGRYDLVDAFIRRDILGVSGQLEWDLGPAQLNVLTGYRTTDVAYTEDYDSTPFPVVHIDTVQKSRQFTQEIRLVSNEADRGFSWILGGFYLSDRGRSLDEFLLPFFELPDELTNARTQTRSIALFGELGYRFSDRFKLTVGLRYSDERKTLALRRSYRFGNGQIVDFVPQATNRVSFDNLSPRLIAEWAPAEDALIYVSATRGFKSGGFNNFPADPVAAGTAFRPEEITAYEFGSKTTLFNRLVRVNIALFHYDYRELQVFAPIDTGAQLPVVQITNAARASIRGAEAELRIEPGPGLAFDLSYAHLQSSYRKFEFGDLDLSGNRLPRAPRNTFTLGGSWSPQVTDHVGIELRAEYVYSSNLFFTPFNDPDLQTGNVGLINASLAIRPINQNWSASMFARNITNKQYLAHGIDALSANFDLKTAQLAAPRQYGITLSWRY